MGLATALITTIVSEADLNVPKSFMPDTLSLVTGIIHDSRLSKNQFVDSSRQLGQVANFVGGFLPDIQLDTPTIMSLVVLVAFVVQLYWTVVSVTLAQATASQSTSSLSSSSSSSATTAASAVANKIVNLVSLQNVDITTTTTAATTTATTLLVVPRTQTVTPAPAPAYRLLLTDLGVPHWVGRRSAEEEKHDDGNENGDYENLNGRTGRAHSFSNIKEINRFRPKLPLYYGANNHKPRSAYHQIRNAGLLHRQISQTFHNDKDSLLEIQKLFKKMSKFPLDYNENNVQPALSSTNKEPEPEPEPIINNDNNSTNNNSSDDDEIRSGRVSWHNRLPYALVSHQLDVANKKTTSPIDSLIYTAERWGQKLKDWHLLPKDSTDSVAHTLLMVRCATTNDPDICGHLDHYYRRQNDLKLAAAIMNHGNTLNDQLSSSSNIDSSEVYHSPIPSAIKESSSISSISKPSDDSSSLIKRKTASRYKVSPSYNTAENRRGAGIPNYPKSRKPYYKIPTNNRNHRRQNLPLSADGLRQKLPLPGDGLRQKLPLSGDGLRKNLHLSSDKFNSNIGSISNKVDKLNPKNSMDHSSDQMTSASNLERITNIGTIRIGPPWNLYLFISVMAVVIFLLDASYRLLRVVLASTNRTGVEESPQDSLFQLITDAFAKWEAVDVDHRMHSTRTSSRGKTRARRRRRGYLNKDRS